jgi:hypothetical protein
MGYRYAWASDTGASSFGGYICIWELPLPEVSGRLPCLLALKDADDVLGGFILPWMDRAVEGRALRATSVPGLDVAASAAAEAPAIDFVAIVEQFSWPLLDLSWMDRSDQAHGFRRVAGTRLALAVSVSSVWDEKRVYDVPDGFRWATSTEVLLEARKCTERHPAYEDQAGWKHCTWPVGSRKERFGFVCSDSLQTGKVQYSSHRIKEKAMAMSLDWARRDHFAGLVCIKNE